MTRLIPLGALLIVVAASLAGCVAPGLDLDAEAQLQSPTEAQSEESAPQLKRSVDEQTAPAPERAFHPGKMRVSMDHAAETLTVEVTFDPCKPGGFVYEQNSLEVEVDQSDRSVTLRGVVEYVAQAPANPLACEHRPEPMVFVSENVEPGPYLIANKSAWMGRGGNGIKAHVEDFRTPAQVENDRHHCHSREGVDIGNISGVWFLQSHPANAMTLSGNASTLSPDSALRIWVGSSVPWRIESQTPYTFNLPSFNSMPLGTVVFQSSTCALVYSMTTGEQTDVLIRQTPEGQ